MGIRSHRTLPARVVSMRTVIRTVHQTRELLYLTSYPPPAHPLQHHNHHHNHHHHNSLTENDEKHNYTNMD